MNFHVSQKTILSQSESSMNICLLLQRTTSTGAREVNITDTSGTMAAAGTVWFKDAWPGDSLGCLLTWQPVIWASEWLRFNDLAGSETSNCALAFNVGHAWVWKSGCCKATGLLHCFSAEQLLKRFWNKTLSHGTWWTEQAAICAGSGSDRVVNSDLLYIFYN